MLVLVVRLAVLVRRAYAGGVDGGLRQLFLAPCDHAVIGRLELLEQRLARFLLQRRGTGGIDLAGLHQPVGLGLGVGPDRRILAGRERRAGDDLLRLVDDALVGELRRADALGGRRTCTLQQLVERTLGRLQAGDVGGVVGFFLDLVEADQEGRPEALRAIHLVERVAILQERQAVTRVLVLQLPQVVGELGLVVELGVVEGLLHFLDAGLLPRDLVAGGLLGHVVDLVIQVLAPLEGQLDRTELQLLLVLLFEPLVQPLALGGDIGGGRRRGGRIGGGAGGRGVALVAGGQGQREGTDDQGFAHRGLQEENGGRTPA